MTFLPSDSVTAFLPTSQVYPEDVSQRLIIHTEKYIAIAQAVNLRVIGIFDKQETPTGKQYFNDTDPERKRFSYRQVYTLGALAAGASTIIAHNITGVNSTTTFTQIYGTAVTATVDNRPIPYANVTNVNQQIEINVDATNINISNGSAAPNITSGIITLEYVKN